MAHFLDERPFDLGRSESRKLVRVLSDLYYTDEIARSLVSKVRAGTDRDERPGISLGAIDWGGAAVDFWPRVLTVAADLLLLRALHRTVVEDSRSASFRDVLRELARPTPELPPNGGSLAVRVAEDLLDEKVWDLVGRFVRDHVLGTDHVAILGPVVSDELAARAVDSVEGRGELAAVMSALKSSPVTVSPDAPPLLRVLLALYEIDAVESAPESAFLLEAAGNLKRYLISESGSSPSDVENETDEGGPQGTEASQQGDPLDVLLLPNGDIFLDRDDIRLALKRLLGGKRSLIVRGDAKTGKSYLFRLVRHISGPKGFNFARVTPAEAGTARELIDVLTTSIDPNLAPFDRLSDPEKWISHASRWLVQQAKARGRWWFVLDGFCRERLNTQLHNTINNIAYFAWELGSDTRLVLLDYDGSLPTELGNSRDEENLRALGETHVREFFVRFFSTPWPGTDPNRPTSDYVDESVVRVLEATHRRFEQQKNLHFASQLPFLQLLHDQVQEVVHRYS